MLSRHTRACALAVIAASVSMMSACGGGGTDGAATAQTTELATTAAGAASSTLTISTAGFIDRSNPFFTPFGNGRSCASCHRENEGWSMTPAALQARFDASNGTDPVFALIDGANSPLLPDATLDQKRVAYSLLLTKGLIRVGMPIPDGAEFELAAVDDPYGFASASELSLFRRPLPSTNLKFNATVMWDARETLADAGSAACIAGATQCFASLDADLLSQADNAVKGHAQAAAGLTAAQQRAIVDFETGLFTAQAVDAAAGDLTAAGARGGPVALSNTDFYFGINDFIAGDYRTGLPFRSDVSSVFSAWRMPDTPAASQADPQAAARASIARGEVLFNTRQFDIGGVRGLNDVLRVATFRGTCASCHSTPDAGTHSVPRLFDTGVSAARRRTPDLPLYTLRNPATGETLQTSDPGAALVTGKWQDISRFKVPGIRGLAPRAPYFHDGSASDLDGVVRFYNARFNIRLNQQEIADLAAFLGAL